jgi:hypothetical protein
MHETLVPLVKGYLDENRVGLASGISTGNKDNFIKGWAFLINLSVAPIRLLINNNLVFDANVDARQDVVNFYGGQNSILNCGFSISYSLESFQNNETIKREIQMFIQDEWVTFFKLVEINSSAFAFATSPPSFIVVDNFYANPNMVREFALKQSFILHPNYHKGKRTEISFAPNGIKEKFESILGKKITGWDCYKPTNGCFQVCKLGDDIVYHSDTQKYAGIIYLTPNAPPNSGTSFFRSKHTLKMKFTNDEYGLVFPNGHLEPSDFEMVDTVGNVFNRLVLFDAKYLHAATSYFGDQDDNCRLFQMFFFDIED